MSARHCSPWKHSPASRRESHLAADDLSPRQDDRTSCKNYVRLRRPGQELSWCKAMRVLRAKEGSAGRECGLFLWVL